MPPGRDNIPLNHPRRIARIAHLSERELAHESELVRRLCAEYRAQHPRRPILIGKAEEIDLLRPEVRRMLDNEGLYIGGDTRTPEAMVPLVSQGGKVFSMKIDSELDPERFVESLTLKGPYLPETPFETQWYPVAQVAPPGLQTVLFAWVRGKGSDHTMRTGTWSERRGYKPSGPNDTWRTDPTHWRELPVLKVV